MQRKVEKKEKKKSKRPASSVDHILPYRRKKGSILQRCVCLCVSK